MPWWSDLITRLSLRGAMDGWAALWTVGSALIARFNSRDGLLHGGDEGKKSPQPVVAQATRTEFGRPRSSMRLRTATPTMTPVACA